MQGKGCSHGIFLGMTGFPRSIRYGIALVACTALLASPLSVAHGKPTPKQPAWGGSDSPLRPGASLGGYCTFNFVFYKPGTKSSPPKAYIGTAGHCTDALDEKVSQPTLGEIGQVVYDSDLIEDDDDFFVDFSLIEIYPKFIKHTNPEVLHWGGPTRIVTEEDLAVGDRIDVYGYGIGLGATEQTRPRHGYVTNWSDDEYEADTPTVNGDSGSPLVHHETGAAFGIISRYAMTETTPPATDKGPFVSWILEELAKAGFNVRLATVRDYKPI